MELLVHPVRLRIVDAMSGGAVLTTAQLCGRLPEVSKATVYRQVGRLVEAGVLDLVGERRVRGAVERSYRLRRTEIHGGNGPEPTDDTDGANGGSPAWDPRFDQIHEAFGQAVSTLVAEFESYLGSPAVAPENDLVDFRQHALWLSDVERAELVSALRAVIAPRFAYSAAPGRRRHLLSPILFPADEAQPPPA